MDEETTFKKFAPFLLNPRLTPRLRKEIEDAIAAHQEKDSSSTQDLQLLRQTLTRHWDKDHRSMIGFANDQWYFDAFALTVGGLLALDYISGDLPLDELPLAEHVLSYGDGQQRARAALNFECTELQLQRTVANTLKYAISEFLIDREHIEARFKAACESRHIAKQRVQQNDSKGFAEIVAKDEAMLKQLAAYNEECREMQKIFPQLVQLNLETKPTEPKSRLGRILDRFRRDKSRQNPSLTLEQLSELVSLEFSNNVVRSSSIFPQK